MPNDVSRRGNGNKLDARNLLRAFYSAVKKAGLEDLRWHDATRHTFATRLVQGGVDIYTVQKLGRWKTISMVQRCARRYPETLRPGIGIEVLNRIRRESVTILSQFQKEGVNQDG